MRISSKFEPWSENIDLWVWIAVIFCEKSLHNFNQIVYTCFYLKNEHHFNPNFRFTPSCTKHIFDPIFTCYWFHQTNRILGYIHTQRCKSPNRFSSLTQTAECGARGSEIGAGVVGSEIGIRFNTVLGTATEPAPGGGAGTGDHRQSPRGVGGAVVNYSQQLKRIIRSICKVFLWS